MQLAGLSQREKQRDGKHESQEDQDEPTVSVEHLIVLRAALLSRVQEREAVLGTLIG